MAQRSKAFPGNAPGPFFVDQSCIDCGTCYTFAPEVFRGVADHSEVNLQPADGALRLKASQALLACPTGSIGTDDKAAMPEAIASFPVPLEDEVHWCGFTSDKSFGAWSYFVKRAAGNVLMDSPRFAPPLMKRLEALGGVSLMVLSHQDDVADHQAFRDRFGCERVMHAGDHLKGIERTVGGDASVALAEDLLFIPTPGHTAGSACLLYRETFLFTGDHLWWNPRLQQLSASKTYNWFSWEQQMESLEKLLAFDFRWVLPGHGAPRAFDDAGQARRELERALKELRTR